MDKNYLEAVLMCHYELNGMVEIASDSITMFKDNNFDDDDFILFVYCMLSIYDTSVANYAVLMNNYVDNSMLLYGQSVMRSIDMVKRGDENFEFLRVMKLVLK